MQTKFTVRTAHPTDFPPHTTIAHYYPAMSQYRRANTANATYFFTVVSYRRRAILCDPVVRAALREAIHQTREQYPFEINAWVLLPDHLHTIWTLPEGDADFSTRWSWIKRQVTQACSALHHPAWMNESKTKRRESTIWQRRFWEHQIRDETDFMRHVDYVHYNPIKHGLVQQVKDWRYSTFHRYVKAGVYPENWGSSVPEISGNFGE